MSHIGKKIILIPNNISIILKNNKILILGEHGKLNHYILKNLLIRFETNKINIIRKNEFKQTRANHGLIRSLIQNIIIGVKYKFTITLIAEGVGYKFQIEKNFLIINIGFTHLIKILIPIDILIKLDSNIKISISSINKEKVGLFSSRIVNLKPVEPYKGKGILYLGQTIIKKIGKRGK